MKIRNKILLYFSITVIGISAISLSLIYWIFSEYREEEFQQRQKEKILLTLEWMAEYKSLSQDLTQIMDKLSINDFFDEKILIFDKDKTLIYSSIDDLEIKKYRKMLNELSISNQWIETKEKQYDLIGIYIEKSNSQFYAISKAYDYFGYSKLLFLRHLLIVIFTITAIIVILMSLYLSSLISKPITRLTEKLHRFKIGEPLQNQVILSNTRELDYLEDKFHELQIKTNEAFRFQRNTIQHISHELKTPIAVIVSELELFQKKMLQQYNVVPSELSQLVHKVISLADIINVLLEISKLETNVNFVKEYFRIDEMVFDILEELQIISPRAKFEVSFEGEIQEEEKLTVYANKVLLKQALQNLFNNAVNYSQKERIDIKWIIDKATPLEFIISNYGNIIQDKEIPFLFQHFFRGENSHGHIGFGLGLVLTKQICDIHNIRLTYSNNGKDHNQFNLIFPV